MAQHDYSIANQGFPAFRSDLNDALAAIVSNNSGATEPTTMFAHQMWVDTAADPSILKIRNADNDAWITIGTINQTGDTFTLTSAVSATTLNTSGAVVFNDAGADVDFRVEGDTDANLLFVDASADAVILGGTSAVGGNLLTLTASGTAGIDFYRTGTNAASGLITAYGADNNPDARITVGGTGNFISFSTGSGSVTERMRIDSSGTLLVGKTSEGVLSAGFQIGPGVDSFGAFTNTRTDGAGAVLYVNRQGSDGTLIEFRQANTAEGSISVSGSTVSYNGGHLSRWAQTLSAKDSSLKKGTVLSNLDEMNVYVKPTLYWTEEDELPVDEEGNPTVAVGDVKEETSVSDNEQLNKVKVSDVEGDPNVAGVFVNWMRDEAHEVDEINMAMTGDMIIRIAGGVTVARGDLLMSAGDGTAKPQGDDIVRSKTIAKVTSTYVTCTYDDGSYCVPCVLMAC